MHGHSAGGTNPSLVEAMFFGRPIIAYDVVYNRETTMGRAVYFKSVGDICRLLDEKIDGPPLSPALCVMWAGSPADTSAAETVSPDGYNRDPGVMLPWLEPCCCTYLLCAPGQVA